MAAPCTGLGINFCFSPELATFFENVNWSSQQSRKTVVKGTTRKHISRRFLSRIWTFGRHRLDTAKDSVFKWTWHGRANKYCSQKLITNLSSAVLVHTDDRLIMERELPANFFPWYIIFFKMLSSHRSCWEWYWTTQMQQKHGECWKWSKTLRYGCYIKFIQNKYW